MRASHPHSLTDANLVLLGISASLVLLIAVWGTYALAAVGP
jgi:hypothetical protein